jgi:hypothetical protein
LPEDEKPTVVSKPFDSSDENNDGVVVKPFIPDEEESDEDA